MNCNRKFLIVIAFMLGAISGVLVTQRIQYGRFALLSRQLAAVEAQNSSLSPENKRLVSPSHSTIGETAANFQTLPVNQTQQPSASGIGSLVYPTIKGNYPAYPKSTVAAAQLDVEYAFGGILDRFNLSSEESARVRKLLAERYIVASDARRQASLQHISNADANKLVAELQAEVDNQIVAGVDPDNAQLITRMIKNAPGLGRASGLDSQVPLTNDQLLSLAEVFTSNYAHWTPGVDTKNISPDSGLSEPDREIISKASAFLTSEQIAALSSDLAAKTVKTKAITDAKAAIAKSYHVNYLK